MGSIFAAYWSPAFMSPERPSLRYVDAVVFFNTAARLMNFKSALSGTIVC